MFLILEYFDGENEYEAVIDKVSNEAVLLIFDICRNLAEEFEDSDFTLYFLEDNSEDMDVVFSIYNDEGKVKSRTCFTSNQCNCWGTFRVDHKIPEEMSKATMRQIERIFTDEWFKDNLSKNITK